MFNTVFSKLPLAALMYGDRVHLRKFLSGKISMNRACWLAFCQANDILLSVKNFNEKVLHSDFKSSHRLWQQSLRWLCILNDRAREVERLLQTKKKNHHVYSNHTFEILFNYIFFPRQLLSFLSFCSQWFDVKAHCGNGACDCFAECVFLNWTAGLCSL